MAHNEIVSQALWRTLSFILNSVDDEGAWGGADYEGWRPIITALTLELLLDCGFDLDTQWTISKRDGPILGKCCLRKTVVTLSSMIQDDGSFGEDCWDAARLGIVIEKWKLVGHFKNYSKLKTKLIEYAKNRSHVGETSAWSGPGTVSVLIDYLDLIHESGVSKIYYDSLIELQFDDGSFHGPTVSANNDLTHPVWHTAQALMTILRRQGNENDAKIQKAVNWLVAAHDRNERRWRAFSHFEVYFTSYAIISMCALKSKDRNTFDSAVDWLVEQVPENGKVRDSGGTIMTALALKHIIGNTLHFSATLAQKKILEDSQEIINHQESELKLVKAELSQFKQKYDGSEIVLTKKEVFVYSLFLAILGIILAIIPYWLSVKPVPVSAPPTQTNTANPNAFSTPSNTSRQINADSTKEHDSAVNLVPTSSKDAIGTDENSQRHP